jgi:HK97 gp10 family phage protein
MSTLREKAEELERKKRVTLRLIGDLVEGTAIDLAPVDLGNFRSSIIARVEEEKSRVIIGSNVDYARKLEFGSSNQAPDGVFKKAIYQNESNIKRAIREGLK